MSAAVANRREPGFSLWARDPAGTWHHFGSSPDREALELKAQGLRFLFTNRKFRVVEGNSPPKR